MNSQKYFPKIPLVALILSFVLLGTMFVFLYGRINENNRNTQTKEAEWQREATRQNEIKTLDDFLKTTENERAQLETHFTKSSDIVPFLDAVEGLASKTGAKIEITSVDIPADDVGLLVGIKASGSFGSIYKFVTLLENFPYELEFTSMDLQQGLVGDAGGGGTTWEAILKVKLLSFVM